jgi:hypothetical protein
MTEYVVLIVGDAERWWTTMSEQERTAAYAEYDRFTGELMSRGHTITGGAELAHSGTARTLRTTNGTVSITDGPYAETVEQLTGFYLVRSEDLDDLAEVCRILADADGAIEIRACLPPPE